MIIDNSKAQVDIEIDDLNMDIDQLVPTKKLTSRKQKEKKVMEFKNRVLSLLEIFIQHKTQPNDLITSLYDLSDVIRQNLLDQAKQSYINRIIKVISLTLQKCDALNEAVDTYQQAAKMILFCLNKKQSSQLQGLFHLFLKVLNKLEQQGIVQQLIIEAFQNYGLKKHSQINEKFLKKIIKDNVYTALPVFKELVQQIQFNGEKSCKQRKRPDLCKLMMFLCKSQKQQLQKHKQLLKETVENVQQNESEQKFHPIAVLKRLNDAYNKLQ